MRERERKKEGEGVREKMDSAAHVQIIYKYNNNIRRLFVNTSKYVVLRYVLCSTMCMVCDWYVEETIMEYHKRLVTNKYIWSKGECSSWAEGTWE